MSKQLYILFEYIKKLKNNSNIKNGILFTFFAFLNNGVNFLLLIILAGYIAPYGYGQLNLFNTSITILSILISLGTNGYIANSYFRKGEEYFKKVVNIVFTIATTVLILFTAIILLIGFRLENVLGYPVIYQMIALLVCFFQLFNTVNLEIWRIKEEPIKYGLYSFCVILLNFSLTIFLVISCQMDWEGRVYAQLIVGIIFFVVSLIFLIRKKILTFQYPNLSILKDTLKYGLPIIPHLSSGWIRQGMDRYIISYFWNASYVGLFSFALNLSNIINIVGLAFNASNSVYIYKNLSNEIETTKEQLLKQIMIMSVSFFILTLIIWGTTYLLIPVFLPKYENSLPYLLPLCFASFFQCIYFQFVNFLFFYRKTRELMYITVSVSLIHLCLSFIATKYSSLYTAYLNLFSNFFICIFVIIYSQKIYPLSKNWDRLFKK